MKRRHIIPQLLYLIKWDHRHDLTRFCPLYFYRYGLETHILHSSASYGQMDSERIISSHGKNVNKVRSTALL